MRGAVSPGCRGRGKGAPAAGIGQPESLPLVRLREHRVQADEHQLAHPLIPNRQGGAELSGIGGAQRVAGGKGGHPRPNARRIGDFLRLVRKHPQGVQRRAPLLPREQALPHPPLDRADDCGAGLPGALRNRYAAAATRER